MSRSAVKKNRRKSIQNRHPNRILSVPRATLELHDSDSMILNRPILDSESPIQTVPLSSGDFPGKQLLKPHRIKERTLDVIHTLSWAQHSREAANYLEKH